MTRSMFYHHWLRSVVVLLVTGFDLRWLGRTILHRTTALKFPTPYFLKVNRQSCIQIRYVKQNPLFERISAQAAESGTTSSGGSDESSASLLRAEAMDLLDCLTSPRDVDHPEFDPQMARRREKLLRDIDYYELTQEMEFRGLSKLGDKSEMITRLLLNVIDPSIDFQQTSGLEANLQYVTESDIAANVVEVIPEERRKSTAQLSDFDADDIRVSKKRIANSPRNYVGGSSSRTREAMVMDDLRRQEVRFPALLTLKREYNNNDDDDDDHEDDAGAVASKQQQSDDKRLVDAYMVRSNDLTNKWAKSKSAIVLLPDACGWLDKDTRVIADELAFSTQSIVIVPDIYQGYGTGRSTARSTFTAFAERRDTLSAEVMNRQNGDFAFTADADHLLAASSGALAAETAAEEYTEWLSLIHNDTIFGDTASAIKYLQQQHDVRITTLAGIGYGAGRALDFAIAVHDAARFSQRENVFDSLSTATRAVAAVNEHSQYATDLFNIDRCVDALNSDDLLKQAVEKVLAASRHLFLPFPTIDAFSSPEGEDDDDEDEEAIEKFYDDLARQKYLLSEDDLSEFAAWDNEQRIKESSDDSNGDDETSQYDPSVVGDDIYSSMAGSNGGTAGTAGAKRSRGSTINSADMEAMLREVIEESPELADQIEAMREEIKLSKSSSSSSFGPQSGSSAMGKSPQDREAELELKLDALDAVQEADSSSSSSSNMSSQYGVSSALTMANNSLILEWKTVLLASARHIRDKGTRWDLKSVFDLNPRAVLAISPHHYDVQRVGSSLVTPAMLLFETNDDQVGGRLDDAVDLASLLMTRVEGDDSSSLLSTSMGQLGYDNNNPNENIMSSSSITKSRSVSNSPSSDKANNEKAPVYDFCVRVYEGLSGESFRSPTTINEMKSSQEMMLLGSLWLDSFAAVNPDQLTMGVGMTKFTSQCFAVVSKQHMRRMHLGSPQVATYVHDDDEVHQRGRWY